MIADGVETKPTFVDCDLEMEIRPESEAAITNDSASVHIEIEVDVKPECSTILGAANECMDQERDYQCYLCNRR